MSATCHGIPDATYRDRAVKAMELFAEWEAEFKPVLGGTARWEGFSYIVREQLERREWVKIIETGTLREPGNWAGDGCSTKIWDWLKEHRGGQVASVDVNRPACEAARKECPHVWVMCEDSVRYLRDVIAGGTTLLYLDSYDYSPGKEVAACMHQVAELASIWERLPSGCLIASDDSHNPDQGKPALTRRLLAMLGIQPVLDSYIVVWKKP